jgi:hypothetical protein
MLERTELINQLIHKNNYESYLEIGVGTNLNFNDVVCKEKMSVDPNGFALFTGTSDEFFNQNKQTFDIVFVDGLHLAEQVVKDVSNSLPVLRQNGVIVIHDCYPEKEERQFRRRVTRNWEGDVWKAIVHLARIGYSMELRMVETGIVLLWNKPKEYTVPKGELTWNWFQKHFKNMLCG